MNKRHRPPSQARLTWVLPLSAAVLTVAAACYPSGVDSITDYNTVSTFYDTAFADGGFKGLSTYSIPGATPANPSSCVIKDLDGGAIVTSPNVSTVCNTVVNQLDVLGYSLVPSNNPTAPSFVVTIAFVSQTYSGWVSYPWYGYWGSYYPGYPWYGWGYYYPTYSYSYDVGTLALQMAVPDTVNSRMNGVWGAAINGVDTAPNNTPAVIQNLVVQAFTQSPYLGK